ncbi:MAG: glutathione S-transferase [Gammaproteobacteria bacterium]|nr:glutathione S-transferase [Gammaproteobacteria bacterium]
MQYKLFMGNQAYSSWSLRGWLLLRPFGFGFEHEVVRLYSPEWERFKAAHFPATTVPTLQVSDGSGRFFIWDSLAIAEFLHERHPDAGIWPEGLQARAAARTLCAEMHSSFFALRSSMPMNVRREYESIKPDAETRADIERIENLWAWVKTTGNAAGPYLFGERLCAADAFFAPVASRFRTYRVALRPDSQRYVDALLAHPATLEFYAAGCRESWIIEEIEFDQA